MKDAKTIPSLLKICRRKFSKKPAFALHGGNKISYADMLWDVSRTAQLLKKYGISKNSKVALFVENDAQTAETFLAVTQMGAVAVILRYDFSREQIAQIIRTEKPEALFIRKDKLSCIDKESVPAIFDMKNNHVLRMSRVSAMGIQDLITSADIALILYQTSGNGELDRSFYTHRQLAESVVMSKKADKPKAVLDSLMDYFRLCVASLLQGSCISV